MSPRKRWIWELLILLLLVSLLPSIHAVPPLPTEIYGDIIYFNLNASPGIVKAYVGTTLCGEFHMVNNTFYGLLDCVGDDPDTPEKEGGVEGDTIRLTYNDMEGDEYGNTTWHSGGFNYIQLVVPILYCGDGFCDFRESCSTCPEDCGECPPPSGGEGGVGGEGGEGTGGVGGIGGIIPPTGAMEQIPTECIENWECTEWGPCLPTGLQYRNCTDLNHCGTTKNKPPEVRECVYVPNCSNGIQDPGEEGIDCGGPCPPCASCFDGIQNCHDGACEEGIDCGGPCPPCKAKLPVIEIPGLVCEKSFRKLFPWVIYFFAILLATIIGRGIYTKRRIDRIEKEKKELRKKKEDKEKIFMEEIKLLKKEWSLKKNFWLYTITVLMLGIVVVLFYYFFGMCPPYHYRIIALFILSLLLLPITIYTALRITEYDELKAALKEKEAIDQHYKYLLELLERQVAILDQKEKDIEQGLEDLTRDEEVRKKLVNPEIKELLNRIIDIFMQYKEFRNSWRDIAPLIGEINDIDRHRALEGLHNVKMLISNIKELFDIYSKTLELERDVEQEEQQVTDLLGIKKI